MVAIPAAPDPYYEALMSGIDSSELADLLDRPAWMADGLCREYTGLSWFPERGVSGAAQKAVCARCLCRRDCLAWAMEHDVEGIWAGTAPRTRLRVRLAGLSTDEILEAIDTRAIAGPSTWETAPCRGCRGLLSRRDLERADGWCWACRPKAASDASG